MDGAVPGGYITPSAAKPDVDSLVSSPPLALSNTFDTLNTLEGKWADATDDGEEEEAADEAASAADTFDKAPRKKRKSREKRNRVGEAAVDAGKSGDLVVVVAVEPPSRSAGACGLASAFGDPDPCGGIGGGSAGEYGQACAVS